MKTRNLIYLAQLEEYDLSRIKSWLKKNPNKNVPEIKHHLKLTFKTRLIYFLTSFFTFFSKNNEKALFLSLQILSPFDTLIKNLLVFLATKKWKFFNKKTITIGITGSWGKTTTKEVLYTILKSKGQVAYTPSNHNTLLAIAKQALFLSPKTKIFICEIGAYQIGDIKQVCSIIHPQVGILTAIGPMHLERFGTLENILKAKMELAQNIPQNSLFIAPKEISSQLKNFSLPKNTLYFKDYSEIYYFIGQQFNLSKDHINNIIKSIPPAEHRRQITKNGDITVIDDTYNSNPAGFRLSLEKLKKIKSTEKILITPGMVELGELQDSENQKIAIYATTICSHIVIVGQTNKNSFEKGIKLSKSKIKTFFVPDFKSAQETLPSIISKNSAILFENDLPDNYF
jgi:UDP-N-acetylmuramoyl-tripeptide--D-alanyl-D-alanine ligase